MSISRHTTLVEDDNKAQTRAMNIFLLLKQMFDFFVCKHFNMNNSYKINMNKCFF